MKTVLIAALFSSFLFTPASIYDFRVNALDDDAQINFSAFRGKKILIVNIATSSPATFQLEGMQQLYNAYREKVVVVAFPAGDDFGNQELRLTGDIRDLCRSSYGITFPITERTSTKGTMQHPVFTYLIEEARKLGYDDPVIKWNFTKFLLDENGQLLRVFPADVTPLSSEITSLLNNDRSWSLN